MGANEKELKGAQTPDELKRVVEPDPAIRILRKQVRELTTKIDAIRTEEGRLTELFVHLGELIPSIEPTVPYYIPPKIKTKVASPCSVVHHGTDWHYGACQDPDEVEGFGEFGPTLAEERVLVNLPPSLIDWVNIKRSNYRIDELVIPATGDMVSGDIQRLGVTNAFPTPVQAVKVGYLWGDFLALLAPHFETVRVEWVCADNHGRLTQKPQSKQEGLNTWNYVVGHIAQLRTEKLKNVIFNIYPLYQKVIAVQNMNYLCMHGHGIRGWAGFPYYGIERKAGREAIKRRKKPANLQFDKVLLGHFHAPLNHPFFIIGGSLSGTDAYDHKEGRDADPCQTAWVVHPKHGEFDWTPFYVK